MAAIEQRRDHDRGRLAPAAGTYNIVTIRS
jgi:hypothetical protein